MRNTLHILLGLALCGSASAGSFIWFNGSANPVTDATAGSPLTGNAADPALGCFAQLVNAGVDGAINPARNRGTAVTGDDQVVATCWFGAGGFGQTDGTVGPGSPVQAEAGQRFFVRAWSAPAAHYQSGIPPAFETSAYGDSTLWTFEGGGDAPYVPVHYNFGGNGFSTLRRAGSDTDGDELPDWWEFLHFRDSVSAEAGDDGDNDRQTNFQEFIAGTIPSDAGSVFAAQATRTESGFAVRWPSAEDRTYTVYRSADLASGFVKIAEGIAAAPPRNEYLDVTDPDTGCAFYLVEVDP